jgi:signal transduction histidine kinase
MVLNLVVNAVQAAAGAKVAAGPTERAHDAEVIVRVQCLDQTRCQIAVGDAGLGPAAAIQDRLFEPFATDKPGGTGLGLVVTRQIAEDHGGLVRWERKEGRTWFLVELPLTPVS